MSKTQRNLYFGAVCVAILAVGILLLAFAAKVANADTLPSQTVHDTYLQATFFGGGNGDWSQALGTGLTGSFNAMSVMASMSFGNGIVNMFLYECDDGTYNISTCSVVLNAADTIPADGTPSVATMSTTTVLSFNPTKYYANVVEMAEGVGPVTRVYGSISDLYPNGSAGNYINATTPIWSGTPADYYFTFTGVTLETGITIDNPTQGTSTPSTTFDINGTYTIGTDLSTFSINGSLPDSVGINLTLLNVATNEQINLGTDYSVDQSVGTHNYATTTTQEQSDYTLIATLVGDYGFTPPPAGCTPFPPFTTCTGTGNIATLATALPPPTFSVDNGLFPILGFQIGSTTSRAGLATTTCSITAIGGCFQNALAFLFFPSPNILDQFSLLWKLIQNKPPFGYVSQTISGLRSINASSTPAFSFGNIPLVDAIFTPIKTGISGLLWIGFFIAWYRGRLRHLDI